MAEALGELALALAWGRVCRCLWMVRGWPCRMVGTLGNDTLSKATLDAFKADYEAWKAPQDIEEPDTM
eukprot:4728412-Lingulodinium_polyedra.AAC.1